MVSLGIKPGEYGMYLLLYLHGVMHGLQNNEDSESNRVPPIARAKTRPPIHFGQARELVWLIFNQQVPATGGVKTKAKLEVVADA